MRGTDGLFDPPVHFSCAAGRATFLDCLSPRSELPMFRLRRFSVQCLAILFLALFCGWNTRAAEPRSAAAKPTGSLISYQVAGDGTFFALSLKAGSLPAAPAREHLVL